MMALGVVGVRWAAVSVRSGEAVTARKEQQHPSDHKWEPPQAKVGRTSTRLANVHLLLPMYCLIV
jgi:hypothetical protein